MVVNTPVSQCTIDKIDPVADLGRLISYLRAQIIAKIEKALEPMDLTAAQYIVVITLARGEINTPAGLSQVLDLDKGAVSRLLDRMEEKGMIKRQPCLEDKRRTNLLLTEKSQALCPQIHPIVKGIYEKTLTGFSIDERRQLSCLLHRAITNLK